MEVIILSATFWNMRRRLKAAQKTKIETEQVKEKPVEEKQQEEKPKKRGAK